MKTTTEPQSLQRSEERISLAVFLVLVVVAFPILLRIGAYQWFLRDEWSFLSGRSLTSLDDLFRPHALTHWSTVPIIAYRVLWAIFGVRTYLPYMALVVALHLVVAVLLRQLMVRAGVRPWLATVGAVPFILFGPGSQNILWAFQIGFTGSIAFGLVQLLLAMREGPFDKRDLLGIGFGVLALMSSGVGVTMAVVVGVAALIVRGWRIAALHTAPLAALYGIWTLVEHPVTGVKGYGRPPVRRLIEWVDSSERGAFLALGHYQVVAWLFLLLLVVGLPLAWSRQRGMRLAIPASLLVGYGVFALTVAQGRWPYGSEFARASRYLYLGAAFTLPALVVAADELARRWRWLTVPLVALLLVPVPANIHAFKNESVFNGRYFDEEQRVLSTVVRMPFADQVPSDVRPIPDIYLSRTLTIGFLLDAAQSGRLHKSTGHLRMRDINEMRSGSESRQRTVERIPGDCAVQRKPTVIRPKKGATYRLTTPVTMVTINKAGATTSKKVVFRPVDGNQITIELPRLALQVAPVQGEKTFGLCATP